MSLFAIRVRTLNAAGLGNESAFRQETGTADRGPLRYFPLSCGTVHAAVPVTSLPARSRAVTVR
jgi:hypothetical protein